MSFAADKSRLSAALRTFVRMSLCSFTFHFATLAAAEDRIVTVQRAIPFHGQEIRAEERAEFDRWVDETLASVYPPSEPPDNSKASAKPKENEKKSASKPKEKVRPAAKIAVGTAEDLERANIDVLSFRVTGKKNLEFPWMLYNNEFLEAPLYYANPIHTLRQLTGKLPHAYNGGAPDENIANGSFFTNTDIESYSPQFLELEAIDLVPVPPMKITKVKKERTSEGIWIKDARGRKYIVLFDSPFCPEMSTSAEMIGSTLARIVGYQVPKVCITTVEGTGDCQFDGRRGVATLALDNFRGGWRHASFRCRREVRALQLMGAWVGNVDQTEQNSGMTVDNNGVVRHYTIDFGAALGSFTFRPQLARLGWTRLFDPYQQFTQSLYDRGIRKVPWEAPYAVQSPAIGYFTANFDPETWQPFYRNLGFIETTTEDRAWLAHRIARVSDEQIHAIVGLTKFSRAEDAEYIAQTIIQRRDVIIRRYLQR